MSKRERMVSTSLLEQRRQELRDEIETARQRGVADEQTVKITEWLLAEWEAAEKDAAREYAPTARASTLTGWSENTLRKYATMATSGGGLPEGWEELRVRRSGSEWTFCISTIPLKEANAA